MFVIALIGAGAGEIETGTLPPVLAWDFTVASDRSNARRALAMRDQAFADLGDTDLSDLVPQGGAPSFRVLSVEENPNPGQIARRVKGAFHPFPTCGPFGTIQFGADPWTANFDCIVPASVATGPPASGRPVLYGHGLFGKAGETARSCRATTAAAPPASRSASPARRPGPTDEWSIEHPYGVELTTRRFGQPSSNSSASSASASKETPSAAATLRMSPQAGSARSLSISSIRAKGSSARSASVP